MTGVCQAPEYAWYSHRPDGSEIEAEHDNAVVFVLDQGFETMEGASGDDWISGAQSMRAYLRASLIACTMAARIRSLGWEAKAHTAADEVNHIPLLLAAGIGELSRIGELVLNMRGSACGRCMKTCPYNTEGVLSERPFQWAAIKVPMAREHIAKLDDKLKRGFDQPRQEVVVRHRDGRRNTCRTAQGCQYPGTQLRQEAARSHPGPDGCCRSPSIARPTRSWPLPPSVTPS